MIVPFCPMPFEYHTLVTMVQYVLFVALLDCLYTCMIPLKAGLRKWQVAYKVGGVYYRHPPLPFESKNRFSSRSNALKAHHNSRESRIFYHYYRGVQWHNQGGFKIILHWVKLHNKKAIRHSPYFAWGEKLILSLK